MILVYNELLHVNEADTDEAPLVAVTGTGGPPKGARGGSKKGKGTGKAAAKSKSKASRKQQMDLLAKEESVDSEDDEDVGLLIQKI